MFLSIEEDHNTYWPNYRTTNRSPNRATDCGRGVNPSSYLVRFKSIWRWSAFPFPARLISFVYGSYFSKFRRPGGRLSRRRMILPPYLGTFIHQSRLPAAVPPPPRLVQDASAYKQFGCDVRRRYRLFDSIVGDFSAVFGVDWSRTSVEEVAGTPRGRNQNTSKREVFRKTSLGHQ